jgi:hypothetical protein
LQDPMSRRSDIPQYSCRRRFRETAAVREGQTFSELWRSGQPVGRGR